MDLAGANGTAAPSSTEEAPFTAASPVAKLVLAASLAAGDGRAVFQVTDPHGETVGRCALSAPGGSCFEVLAPSALGALRLHADVRSAGGLWRVRVLEVAPRGRWPVYLLQPVLMMAAAGGPVLGWHLLSSTPWRWFGYGALVWAVAIGGKALWALSFHGPALRLLGRHVPWSIFPVLAGLYVGLLTGVLEIGLTLLAAWRWPELAHDLSRAVAVGLGAGALEAAVLALQQLHVVAPMALGWPGTEGFRATVAAATADAPLPWLLGPTERCLALITHAASRVLVLLAVASGRQTPFWWAFWLMSGIDGLAGYLIYSGALWQTPKWQTELRLSAFAALSVAVLGWYLMVEFPRWP